MDAAATTQMASGSPSVGVLKKKGPRSRKKDVIDTSDEILRDAVSKKVASTQLFVVNADGLEYLKDELKKIGIVIKRAVLFEGKKVLAFTTDELNALLMKLRLIVSLRHPSQTRKIEWVWLSPAREIPKEVAGYVDAYDHVAHASVSSVDFNGHGEEHFTLIASKLFQAVKRAIVLSVPHKEPRAYDPTGPFQIYIWSTPEGVGRSAQRNGTGTPSRIFGVEVVCQDDPYVPENKPLITGGMEHHSIIIRDGTYAVAELFPNALYIHHDLVHKGHPLEFKLFSLILDRCLPFIMDPKVLAKYHKNVAINRAKAERLAFTTIVQSSVLARATRQENAIKIAKETVAKKQVELFEAERGLFAEMESLVDPKVAMTRFSEEFEKLRNGKVHLIDSITFSDPSMPSWITFHTDEIYAEHPRTRDVYLIGRCDVSVNLDNGKVRVVNRDRRYDGGRIHTPHVVNGDGSDVCLGNISKELRAYVAHYEIEAVAILMVAFLQSVSDGELHIDRLEKFPVVKKANP